MLETTWKNGIMKDGRSTAERCTEVPPFTFCGLEMFVLLIIKERRSELKCYGVMLWSLGHSRGDSLTNPMLIIVFSYNFDLKAEFDSN